MKRLGSVLSVLMFIGLVLGIPGMGFTQAAKGGASISMVLEGSDYSQAAKVEALFKSILADYEKTSGNKVEFLFVPDKDYRTWTIIQQAAGNLPDVSSTRLAWAWEDFDKGMIQQMDPFLAKESPYAKGQKWGDTFVKSLTSQSVDPTTKSLVTALRSVTAVRILYNKDLFAKAGITKEPNTWIEFIDACKKLQAIKVTPFASATQGGAQFTSWLLTTLFGQLDKSLRDKMDVDKDNMVSKNELARATDLNLIDYSKAPFKDGLELLKEFAKYWNKDFNAVDTKGAQQLWLTGRAAMVLAQVGDLITVDSMQGRNFAYGAIPLPMVTKATNPLAMEKSVMLGGAANETWAISKASKGAKLDAAVDLVMYLTSPSVQGRLARGAYFMPVITNADLPDNLKGFTIRDNEDIRRANYTGPVTINEFSSFLTMIMQLYLVDSVDFATLSSSLNKEWKKGMAAAKTTSGWSEANNYEIKIKK